jgi:hypothetical protein
LLGGGGGVTGAQHVDTLSSQRPIFLSEGQFSDPCTHVPVLPDGQFAAIASPTKKPVLKKIASVNNENKRYFPQKSFIKQKSQN